MGMTSRDFIIIENTKYFLQGGRGGGFGGGGDRGGRVSTILTKLLSLSHVQFLLGWTWRPRRRKGARCSSWWAPNRRRSRIQGREDEVLMRSL